MRFQVFAHDLLIGESDLPDLDPSMGIASGPFVQATGYQTVKPVFLLYTAYTVAGMDGLEQDQEMLERYWRESDDLNLAVRLPEGETMPVQWVHIEDFLDELGEIALTVCLYDGETFARFFE